jgi:hypothetical protein
MGFWEYLDSNFAAALFGAFLGAGAAQFFAARSERKRELQKEIRSTDAAIALAFNVVLRSIALKEQSVRETWGLYELRRNALITTHALLRSGVPPPGNEILVELDLKRIDPLSLPVERLEAVVLNEISARGRIPQLAITIGQCLASMNQSIELRNSLVDTFKTAGGSESERIARYFSLPYNQRAFDTSFRDALRAIQRQNDDCIWFALKLCRDLEKHAVALRAEYKRNRFLDPPKPVFPVDFLMAKSEGLIPDDDPYIDWERSFYHIPGRTTGRWRGKAHLLLKKSARRIPGWRRFRRWRLSRTT